MTTLTQILGDINETIDDVANTKVSEAQKIRYINMGQQAMWPKIWQVVQDETTVLATDTYEYAVPAALNQGQLLGVEIESTSSSSDFQQVDGLVFDLVPNASYGQTMRLKDIGRLPSEAGSAVRFTAAIPLTPLVTGTDVYSGPAFTDELPFMYAMSRITARDFDDRIVHQRFNSTQALNGVLLSDITDTADWWLGQFLSLLEQVKMPMPSL